MSSNDTIYNKWAEELDQLKMQGNFRSLPLIAHDGKWIIPSGKERLLNLSSNDYLGLGADKELMSEFWQQMSAEHLLMTSSSSRLLTGNFDVFEELEALLARLFHKESALVFNCGYHANAGILPAICDEHTLILADKLVHASLIDGIRLAGSKYIRYRHNQYSQLERLLEQNANDYQTIVIVVESIYSMDGDVTDLPKLVELKKKYNHVLLYVDEAHAVGVRGDGGLGLAEEQGCVDDIDILIGTLGKAMASSGAYVVCRRVLRDYLVNRMRPFIFTTALPPICISWTIFLFQRLAGWRDRRNHLSKISQAVQNAVAEREGGSSVLISQSQIIPLLAGDSSRAIAMAEYFQRKGFYVLPVRPPSVPVGTARLRFSLSAAMTDSEVSLLTDAINQLNADL